VSPYSLCDIEHAVLPTKRRLDEFCRELVETQQVLNKRHLGFAAQRDALFHAIRLLARGQGSFFRMLWKFNSVYDPARQLGDHQHAVPYRIAVPAELPAAIDRTRLARAVGCRAAEPSAGLPAAFGGRRT
jgi:hopanoid C-3 methylase